MKYNVYILFIIILCSTFFTQANVIYSGTRFIYNEDDNDIIINIKNKNSATDYLIQSWITKDENDKNTPFMITPPLFKLNKEQSAILRIAKITSIAQTDRESLFYINSKAIPIAESKNNSIHISIKSVFKLFYRPHGLTETVEEATKKIIFSINNKKEMIIKNNSEYYFTIINIFSNGEKKEISVMLSPFSEINKRIVLIMIKLSPISLLLLFTPYVYANALYLQAIENHNGNIDFSLLLNENFLEGTYNITIYINNNKKQNSEISFKNKNNNLTPIITLFDLKQWGINTNYYEPLKNKLDNDIVDYDLLKKLFNIKLEINKQSIYFKVPLIAIEKNTSYSKEKLDDGDNAAFIKYHYQGHYYKQNSLNGQHIHNLQLYNGINLFAWRYRQDLNYNNNNSFSINQQYVYRTLRNINSILTMGDFYAYSPNLNTYKILGVQINSDNAMKDGSLVGYAPIISETAYTYAEVSIEQNGETLYSTSVPPGPFTLNNLPSLGTNGELVLIIKEENGEVRKKKIWNYSSQYLLRKNQWNYYYTMGLVNNPQKRQFPSNKKKELLTQLNLSYGVSNYLTTMIGAEKKEMILKHLLEIP